MQTDNNSLKKLDSRNRGNYTAKLKIKAGAAMISVMLSVAAGSAFASAPEGYYQSLDGKQGAALESALKALSDGHTTVTYNTKTWGAFEKTDVRDIDGRKAWWDMYSNRLVYAEEHGSLNIEHSVANSWWGGKSGSVTAYSDLFHLNPSNAVANVKKGDNPPGETTDARLFDNGILRIGTPAQGQGGGATSVFEPADEYKGDFARAYFYIFTSYSDLGWKEDTQYVYGDDNRLQPWAAEMLMRWHREDPVDSKELNRNEEIYGYQHNRNPFIDYPELAEYIWGDKQGESFALATATEATATDRPAAPKFVSARMTDVNTYSRRWWDGFGQEITHGEGMLMVSLDGRDYYESDGVVQFDPAMDGSESHTIKAYAVKEADGRTLRSPIATLTLLARDPSATEYSTARWQRFTTAINRADLSGKWVIASGNCLSIMSSTGGTTSVKYMENAGLPDTAPDQFYEDGYITELPLTAAIVEFEPVGNSGKYKMSVSDIKGNFKGYWNSTAKNSMKLDATTYTPGTFEGLDTEQHFRFRFDQYGALRYNKTQERYVNYEDNSNQTPVYAYFYVDMQGGTGLEDIAADGSDWSVGVDGDSIIAPEGASVYDLNGRRVSGKHLHPGVYIVTGAGRSVKIAL